MEHIRNKQNQEIVKGFTSDPHGFLEEVSGAWFDGNEINLRIVERPGYLEDMRELRIAIEIGPKTGVGEIRDILPIVKDYQQKLNLVQPIMTNSQMLPSLFQELKKQSGREISYTNLAKLYNKIIKYKKETNWFPELSLADLISDMGFDPESISEIEKMDAEDITSNYPIDGNKMREAIRYRENSKKPGILTLLRSKKKVGKA